MAIVKIVNEGVIEYGVAFEHQNSYFKNLLANIGSNEDNNYLLYCEHPHVYTLGKSGEEDNLLVTDNFLKNIGATFYKTDRGGDITYHGYGQLVGYPIIDLSCFNLSLRSYIEKIEDCVIETIKEYGIEGYRVNSATGVWVNTPKGERKICAIGVKASRYVTMHGFALNVNTDLNYFSYINPCGITTKGVTSIKEICGREIDMSEVQNIFSKHFSLLFGCAIK